MLLLKGINLLPVAIEYLGNIPALQAGIGVNLGAVVHLMLQQHHQDAPATEGAVGICQGLSKASSITMFYPLTSLVRQAHHERDKATHERDKAPHRSW